MKAILTDCNIRANPRNKARIILAGKNRKTIGFQVSIARQSCYPGNPCRRRGLPGNKINEFPELSFITEKIYPNTISSVIHCSGQITLGSEPVNVWPESNPLNQSFDVNLIWFLVALQAVKFFTTRITFISGNKNLIPEFFYKI